MAHIAILYPMNHENIGPLKGTQSIREKCGEIKSYRIEKIGDAQAVTEIIPYVDKLVAEHGTFFIEEGEYVAGTHLCYERKAYEVWGRIDGFEDRVITYRSPAGHEYQVIDGDTRILKFKVACKVDEILNLLPLGSPLILMCKDQSTMATGELRGYDQEHLELFDGCQLKSYTFDNLISLRIV